MPSSYNTMLSTSVLLICIQCFNHYYFCCVRCFAHCYPFYVSYIMMLSKVLHSMLQSFVMLDVLFKLIISSYALETGRDGYYFIIRSRKFYFRVPPVNKMITFKKITFMRNLQLTKMSHHCKKKKKKKKKKKRLANGYHKNLFATILYLYIESLVDLNYLW